MTTYENYTALANAIIKQAAEDWRTAGQKGATSKATSVLSWPDVLIRQNENRRKRHLLTLAAVFTRRENHGRTDDKCGFQYWRSGHNCLLCAVSGKRHYGAADGGYFEVGCQTGC